MTQGVILSPGDVHINAALGNVSFAYMQSADNFIADKVFPIVPVQKQSDLIWNFDGKEWSKAQLRKRAVSTESAVVGLTASTDTYFAHVYSLAHDIGDQTRDNADSAWNLDRLSTESLTQRALVSRESIFIDTYLKTGVWGTDLTGVAATPTPGTSFLQWSNPASTPIEDIRLAARMAQKKSGGLRPNKLVVGRKVFDTLVDHPDIVDRVKYGQTPNGAALVNMQALAALFEVDRVLVANAVTDEDFMFDNAALLVYSPDTPSVMMPAAGLTYAWTGYRGANGFGGRIKKFRMEHLATDRIEIELAFDQRVIGKSLGVFFATATAPDA